MISKGATTVLVLAVLVQATCGLPAPQWFSFKDGKFGVGYGGYHAEAGLGGLLTGNTAHGGLVASAGTPNGQHAGAGLGGLLDGNDRTSGGGYAGATAGHGVGASAAFGGTLNNEGSAGGLGAESHVPGTSNKVVEIGQTKSASSPGKTASVHEGELHTRFNDETSFHKKTKTVLKEVNTELQAPPAVQPPSHGYIKTVYKKKVITRPHKDTVVQSSYDNVAQGGSSANDIDLSRLFDFQAFSNIAASYSYAAPPSAPSSLNQDDQNKHHDSEIQKEVHLNSRFDSNGHSSGSTLSTQTVQAAPNLNFWNDIFNIPISTLSAVNQFLNNKSNSGTAHVQKHVEIH
ncbi:merozoite surface protein 2 isoform X1 [Armigeres subalbatus]|uniref:merozoite surface protein 2 isoform X1 n=1 Tax=Armigeres subalbatus TaxID=124917 RepID=UPI002ED508C8